MTSKQQITFKIKAALFDMDGVITDTMPFHFQAWQKVLGDEGVDVNHLDIYSREGQRGMTSVQEIFETYQKPYTDQKAIDILKKKEVLFKQIVQTRFIPGILDFLKRLRNEQITLALVTGTSRHELLEILPKDVRSLFEVIVTGTDVKNGKPDPEPYLLALEKLDLTAEEAIVFENAPFGIQAANAAGLKCLALATSLPKSHLCAATAVFSSIKDLCEDVQCVRMNESEDA